MSDREEPDFLLKLVFMINPLVRVLLMSPLHSLVSKDIMLLHFQGRKSGKWFATPVSFVDTEDGVRTLTSTAWWKNLRDVPRGRIHLRGEERFVNARVDAGGGERVVEAIDDFLRKVPRDARFYSVRMSGGVPNREDVEEAAKSHVLIDLEVEPPFERPAAG